MIRHKDSGAHIAELIKMDKTALPEDGGENFNRLIFAKSPYLLQHAENPVQWYQWGEEAFEKARSENLPILLSIGYATCHWCHVMAHESFADEEVANILNSNFVCIKVDREERPDIDDFYMTVAHVLTGGGGWPLNVFLTPDKQPFFAMTYLPKNERNGMGGFIDLLTNITALWTKHPAEIEKNCNGIMGALEQLQRTPSNECPELNHLRDLAFKQLAAIYDDKNSGFGKAPKFPMPINLSWLIEIGASGNDKALKMALDSLRKMRQGGIWDQLGGGLHRYAVDEKWLVPHFEKMLYDQAMVALTSLEAYQVSEDEFFLGMAENILSFVSNELSSSEGGFYSALDADSEGQEGKSYVWKMDEVEEILGEDAELFCRFYGITENGNFEGHNILNISQELEAFCSENSLDLNDTAGLLDECSERLLEFRSERIQPLRDEKIITSWNGLMIAAYAKCSAITGDEEYLAIASDCADFILNNMRREDGRLLRSYLCAPSEVPAFLEDYAFLCYGLFELFDASLEDKWLELALTLMDDLLRYFRDPESGSLVKTGLDAEQIPAIASLNHDGVTPSAFSMAAKCMIRLGHACDRMELLDHAHAILAIPLDDSLQNPVSHLGSLQAFAMLENEPVICTFCGEFEEEDLQELICVIGNHKTANWFIRRENPSGSGSVNICTFGTCHPPVHDADELEKLLAKIEL